MILFIFVTFFPVRNKKKSVFSVESLYHKNSTTSHACLEVYSIVEGELKDEVATI